MPDGAGHMTNGSLLCGQRLLRAGSSLFLTGLAKIARRLQPALLINVGRDLIGFLNQYGPAAGILERGLKRTEAHQIPAIHPGTQQYRLLLAIVSGENGVTRLSPERRAFSEAH